MITLTPVAPYSFDLFTRILSRYPAPGLFRLRDGAYYRTLMLDDGVALVRVTASGTVTQPQLHIETLAGNPEKASERIQRVPGIDADLQAFYDYARENGALWHVVEPLIGLPLYREESVFQALMFVIIEQHISWVNAQKAQRLLVEWGNNTIEHDGFTHYAMPSPQQIASATQSDFKPLKITFKRMDLMINLAKRVVSGDLDLEGMLRISPEDMYNELLKIKGIGHWTASVVVSRSRGIYPYVPHNDVALQAAVKEYFKVEKSAVATSETFAQFGDYAGLAAHFTLMRWVLDKYPVQSAE